MIPLVSMNGTLHIRRSASIVLYATSLFLGACGVEMSGLNDGPEDARSADSGHDVSMIDRVPDRGVDTTSDRSSTDGLADAGGNDARIDASVDGDAARDPIFDGGTRTDAGLDADATTGPSVDVGVDVVRDGDLDGDGPRDTASDPSQDLGADDATTEPSFDVVDEQTIDAVADAPSDRSAERDAERPISCTGSCNTFPNVSQTVMRTVDSGPTPAMTGGNLADGTYVVTSIVQYNGDVTPFSLAETSVIAGNLDAWVASTNGNPEVRYTTTYVANNNQLALSFCCPTPGNLTILYTTDGTTISHIDPANPNRVITYTRQ
jgi:hypothetical protein